MYTRASPSTGMKPETLGTTQQLVGEREGDATPA